MDDSLIELLNRVLREEWFVQVTTHGPAAGRQRWPRSIANADVISLGRCRWRYVSTRLSTTSPAFLIATRAVPRWGEAHPTSRRHALRVKTLEV